MKCSNVDKIRPFVKGIILLQEEINASSKVQQIELTKNWYWNLQSLIKTIEQSVHDIIKVINECSKVDEITALDKLSCN